MLHIRQRLETYRFFASLFRYPDADLLQEIETGKISEIASWLQIPSLELPPECQHVEALQENYTGLFVARQGGVPAPLYGSVYLDDGQLMGASSRQVAECYRRAGLHQDIGGEPADFLSTELEYLYYLVGEEAEGLAARKLERGREMTAAQQDFLSRLLLPWLDPFVQRMQGQDAGIYSWGAAALLTFIRQELVWLNKMS